MVTSRHQWHWYPRFERHHLHFLHNPRIFWNSRWEAHPTRIAGYRPEMSNHNFLSDEYHLHYRGIRHDHCERFRSSFACHPTINFALTLQHWWVLHWRSCWWYLWPHLANQSRLVWICVTFHSSFCKQLCIPHRVNNEALYELFSLPKATARLRVIQH